MPSCLRAFLPMHTITIIALPATAAELERAVNQAVPPGLKLFAGLIDRPPDAQPRLILILGPA
ncbi:MAG TPA: hypothetical protein VD963_07450 [Phycisphaerales bacterium]|nr:hypothetical protein [Phycisphaerales bacterium]